MSGYVSQGVLKETWQQDLQGIEQRRNDLLPEYQKMQKTQKLQSPQDKKEQCQKDLANGLETVSG